MNRITYAAYSIFSRIFPGRFKPLQTRYLPGFQNYEIGPGTYGAPKVFDFDGKTSLHIGRYCSIAPEVRIFLGGEHHVDWVTTYPFSAIEREARQYPGHPHTKGPVTIENDVWIGYGAIILSGVKIGNGAVIGAGSVVSKNVPAYTIFAGNPARMVRKRFSDEVIERLEKIAWWEWPEERIRQAWPELLSNNIEEFIEKHLI